jgi:hypothetical protein
MGSQGPQPTSTTRFDPTWRRMAGSALVLFLVILAFLVGRVRAGVDPGLASTRAVTPTPQQAAPPSQQSAPAPQQAPAPQGSDPSTESDDFGGRNDFGNAVPDDDGFDQEDDGSAQGFDQGSGSQGFDPPSTHVS